VVVVKIFTDGMNVSFYDSVQDADAYMTSRPARGASRRVRRRVPEVTLAAVLLAQALHPSTSCVVPRTVREHSCLESTNS
jgi:hypothetical protein